MAREMISTKDAPAPVGHYSQALKVGNTLYVAGQIPLDAAGSMVEGGVEAQAHQCMKNVKAVVEAAGFTMDEVVQCQVFLADLNDGPAVNGVYKEYFPNTIPTRAALQVARLPKDALIEVLATAVKD